MSNFYGSMKGSRGEVTRQGHGNITAHIRSWNVGIQVNGLKTESGNVFEVWLTGGSSCHCASKLLGTYSEADLF